MDGTTLLNLISRWLHVIPVIVMVGGTLFLRLALLPALAASENAELRDTVRESVRKKWAKWIGISTLLLLVTGLYNAYFKAITYELSPLYNGLLLVKILLAFAVFYLAARLSGRSAKAVQMRQREIHWTNILCVLMLTIVLLAGAMKIVSTGAPIKVRSSDTATMATE
jgi:uncharacterized membrane protein